MHTTVTEEAGRAFVSRSMTGPVVMLNLLRFRDRADYADSPELAPQEPITGEAAYKLYMHHTRPLLEAAGGELVFIGDGGCFLIGPSDETWDLVMLIRHRGVGEFLTFAANPDYQAILGHRTAAVVDSRLLPIAERLAPGQ